MAPRKGFVKQLSNLAIDEISTVDRGANQHSLIAIAKRASMATTVDDYWPEDVSKEEGHNLITAPFSQQRKANYRASYEKHPKISGAAGLMTGHGAGATSAVLGANLGGTVAGGVGGYHAAKHFGEGAALGGAVTGAIAGGASAGAAAGAAVHHHYHGRTTVTNVHKSANKAEEILKSWPSPETSIWSDDSE